MQPDDPRRNMDGGPAERPPEPELETGIPVELAVARAAMYWEHKILPLNPAVRTCVRLRRDNPKDFIANWQKLEQLYRESGGGIPGQPSAGGPVVPVVEERLVDPVSERVIGECEAWLEKRRVEAEAKAQAIERGEKA
jgi:hypothetical protein